jgi:hypothetical protein
MSPELEGMFEQFWAIYPRKVAKIAAWRAWKKLAPSELEAQKILSGLWAYKTYWVGRFIEIQFLPHPATFLNQRRWEDEICGPCEETKQPEEEHCLFKKGYVPSQLR